MDFIDYFPFFTLLLLLHVLGHVFLLPHYIYLTALVIRSFAESD